MGRLFGSVAIAVSVTIGLTAGFAASGLGTPGGIGAF